MLDSGSALRSKSYVIDANYYKGGNIKHHEDKPFHQLRESERRCIVRTNDSYRKLTVLECERLQTLPDNYTIGVSNKQRYKCIGNGWTTDVIVHLLKELYG